MNDMMQIVDTNPILFCRKLQEAVQDGYVIDDNSDFSMFWNLYTIGMKKVPKRALIESVFPAVALFKENAEHTAEVVAAKKPVGRPVTKK